MIDIYCVGLTIYQLYQWNNAAQARNIDKKHKEDDGEEEVEEEGEDDISESSVDEEEEDQAVAAEDGDIKARIFAALGSVMADVHSDSDDNCPVMEESDESSDDADDAADKTESAVARPKVSLKAKRHTVLQLRQFRHRCIDLVDTAIQHAPRLGDRLAAFLVLLHGVRKADVGTDGCLTRAAQSFRRFRPTEAVTAAAAVAHINELLAGVQRCPSSRPVLQALGCLMVALLRMAKHELSAVVDAFRPLLEQCVVEKRKNPLKAVFMTTFETFPDICWAFHEPMLAHVDAARPQPQQFQAISVLRKVVTNAAIRNVVRQAESVDAFATKEDIVRFVVAFGGALQALVLQVDVQASPKYAALVVGSLTDCLRTVGAELCQVIRFVVCWTRH